MGTENRREQALVPHVRPGNIKTTTYAMLEAEGDTTTVLQPVRMDAVLAEFAEKGHGHVLQREDGLQARCGEMSANPINPDPTWGDVLGAGNRAAEIKRLQVSVESFLHQLSGDPDAAINWDELPEIFNSYAQQFAKGQDAIARVAELEARPTPATYRENATNDEWIFLPEDRVGCTTGFRLRDKLTVSLMVESMLKQFTPLSPAEADAPIVKFDGARVVWSITTGEPWTLYPCGHGYTRIRHSDGFAEWDSNEPQERRFTRTKPVAITLPPEQEKLVGPLAERFAIAPSEARSFLESVGASK